MEPRSVRLNQGNRYRFINLVMGTLMPVSEAPNTEEFIHSKRNTIYEYIYGPHKKAIDALPDWMKMKVDCIRVRLGGQDINFSLEKQEFIAHGRCELSKQDPLAIEYSELRQQMRDWQTKRNQLHSELRKVVEACNTSAQLYLAWPKALDFAECFPYKGTKAQPKPKVSAAALDLTLDLTKSQIVSPSEN